MEEVWSSQGSKRKLLNWATRTDRSSLRDRQEHVKQHTWKPYTLTKLPEQKRNWLIPENCYSRAMVSKQSTVRAPKAQETPRKGKWKECMARRWAGTLQQTVFMTWQGCCTCELTAPVLFYIKTCTKSSQSTFQTERQWLSQGTTSSWSIISSYWQLMVSGEGRVNFLQVCGPGWLPMF